MEVLNRVLCIFDTFPDLQAHVISKILITKYYFMQNFEFLNKFLVALVDQCLTTKLTTTKMIYYYLLLNLLLKYMTSLTSQKIRLALQNFVYSNILINGF